MAKLLDVRSGMRRELADGLKQAQRTLKQSGHQFLAPSFPGMIAAGDCRLLDGALIDGVANAQQEEVQAVTAWPELGLVTTTYPVLVFVLEGEVDFRLGVTPTVLRRVPSLPLGIRQYVVTAHVGQFLLIPSDFPRPDGTEIHWERTDKENAASTLMWLIFRPTGCFIHFCKTQGHEHSLSKSIYLTTSRAYRLVEEAQAEVLQGRAHWEAATQHYLEIVLLLLQRDLSSAQVEIGSVEATRDARHRVELMSNPPHPALQRAQHFIEDHLQDPLRTPQIASVAGVSTSSLNQLFRKHLQTSVAHYVNSRRLERASTLLRETNLAVSQVAAQSGFAKREHFSRTFSRTTGFSPLSYRRHHQKANQAFL